MFFWRFLQELWTRYNQVSFEVRIQVHVLLGFTGMLAFPAQKTPTVWDERLILVFVILNGLLTLYTLWPVMRAVSNIGRTDRYNRNRRYFD